MENFEINQLRHHGYAFFGGLLMGVGILPAIASLIIHARVTSSVIYSIALAAQAVGGLACIGLLATALVTSHGLQKLFRSRSRRIDAVLCMSTLLTVVLCALLRQPLLIFPLCCLLVCDWYREAKRPKMVQERLLDYEMGGTPLPPRLRHLVREKQCLFSFLCGK